MMLIQNQSHEDRHEAFAVLVRRHTDRFYALAYRLLFKQAEAEDIVQDAFLKVWDKPTLWKSGKSVKFTTWFYRIVVNACYDQNKRKSFSSHTSMDFDEIETKNAGPEDNILYSEVEQALIGLPDRQRTAIALCFYEGLSNKEAAEVLDIRLSALQSLVMRGKEALKTKLGLSGENTGENAGESRGQKHEF